jgi:hypothetical protein
MVVRVRLRLTKGDENPAKFGEGGITAERVNLASIQYWGGTWSRSTAQWCSLDRLVV